MLLYFFLISFYLIFLITYSRASDEPLNKDINYFYSVLEAVANDDNTVIHDKYKKLALKYHPDRNKSKKDIASQKMAMINEAYEEILKYRKTPQLSATGSLIINSLTEIYNSIIEEKKQSLREYFTQYMSMKEYETDMKYAYHLFVNSQYFTPFCGLLGIAVITTGIVTVLSVVGGITLSYYGFSYGVKLIFIPFNIIRYIFKNIYMLFSFGNKKKTE